MKKILVATLVLLSWLCLSTSALAQTKEIRVLLANHPYGDLLKAAIPILKKLPVFGSKSNNCRKASSARNWRPSLPPARRLSMCS